MTEREALKLALEDLKRFSPYFKIEDTITAIKEALAQPEQEPVAITITGKLGNIYSFTGDYSLKKGDKVYTTPPRRKPLPPQSPCEMTQAEGKMFKLGWLECEAAHGIKEKNT